MTYQVVNPATGEIATMTGDGEGDRKICIKVADKLAADSRQRWDVIQIMHIHTAEPKETSNGSKDPRN